MMRKYILFGIIAMILLISVMSVCAADILLIGSTAEERPASQISAGQGSSNQDKQNFIPVHIDADNNGKYEPNKGDFEMKITQSQYDKSMYFQIAFGAVWAVNVLDAIIGAGDGKAQSDDESTACLQIVEANGHVYPALTLSIGF